MRFGTDGIRGRAGRPPIDAAGAGALGAVLGTRSAGVIVARDTRPSGPDLAAALAEAAAGHVGVHDLGVVPTAALALAVAARPGWTGVMITASHNPAVDNGFKVVLEGGRKPTEADAAALEQALTAPPPATARHPVTDEHAGAVEAWADAVAGRVDRQALAGRHLVVDLAHGAATAVAEALAARLPRVRFTWRGRGDGVINDGVGSEHPAALQRAVRDLGADAGLAVDGDADRALLVDADGAVVPGDALLGWLAVSGGHRAIAVTVMSSWALEAALPGVVVHRTPVGDRHVVEAVRAGRATFGGEESGHVCFADGLPGGDGLLTGLRALAAAFGAGFGLAEATRPFRPWPRRLLGLPATERLPLDAPPIAPQVEAVRPQVAPGRVMLRWSGTEAKLRVLVEGPDAGAVDAAARTLEAGLGEVLR